MRARPISGGSFEHGRRGPRGDTGLPRRGPRRDFRACAPAKAPGRSLTSVGRRSSSMNGAELPLRRCVRGGLRPTAFGNGALASARRGPRASGRTAECRPRAPLQPRRRAASTFSGLPIGSAMERGRALVWVARAGILSASRRSPSASIRAQLSRVRSHTIPSFRYPSGDAARSLPEGGRGGPGAASPHQRLAPRATTTKPGPGTQQKRDRFVPQGGTLRPAPPVDLLAMVIWGFSHSSRPQDVAGSQ